MVTGTPYLAICNIIGVGDLENILVGEFLLFLLSLHLCYLIVAAVLQ
jgi:hypothetical protein